MGKKKDEIIIWQDRKHFMWFPFSFTKYQVKNERLYTDRGLFSTVSDEVLLYRIVDITLKRTLAQKIFGTGTIELLSKVDRDATIHLENIRHPKEVKTMLSNLIEKIRDEKRVVGKEFYGDSCTHNHFDASDIDLSDENGNGIPDELE